ncbi:MAG: hypothetical protein Q7S39_01915 [Ignavibacteria bacterium]|nr:hypothetical protein [Ignavibacteria bacterium]
MHKISRLIVIAILLNFMPAYPQEKIIFLDSLIGGVLQNNSQSAMQYALANVEALQNNPQLNSVQKPSLGSQQKLDLVSFWEAQQVDIEFIQIRLVLPQSYKGIMNEPYYFFNVLITRRNK